MGAYRKRGWLAGAAWAALGLGVAPPMALAQSPPRSVEVWYGLERVSGGPEAAPRPSAPAPPKPASAGTGIAPGVYVLPAASYPFTPNTPPPGLRPGAPAFLPNSGHSAPEFFPDETAKPGRGAILPMAHWSDDWPGRKLDSAIRGKPARTHAEAARRTAPVPEGKADKPAATPSPPAPPPAPVPEEKARPPAEREGPSKFLYHVALVQVLSALGSLVVGPLVLLLTLLFVLRRYKATGSLLRVEVVNSGTPAPTIVYGGPAAWPAPAPVGGDGAEVQSAEAQEPETTAQPFDLGPTYAEERQQREEAERLRERAVLQHVYEDNVRLREQLEQAAGATPA